MRINQGKSIEHNLPIAQYKNGCIIIVQNK